MILRYDLTYLAILLSGPASPETDQACCISSPVRPRTFVRTTDALDTAADLSVILAWHQLRDGVADRSFFRGLPCRCGARLLRGACQQAAARRPDFDRSVREQLDCLTVLEQIHSPSLDAAADAFACLLAGAAESEPNAGRRRVLHEILYHLGRWIYLVDAADDLSEDLASGNYNPVALRYGVTDGRLTGEARASFARTLDHSIHRIAAAYELADFGCWSPILEATFYTGLFQTGHAVLDGVFHKRKQ